MLLHQSLGPNRRKVHARGFMIPPSNARTLMADSRLRSHVGRHLVSAQFPQQSRRSFSLVQVRQTAFYGGETSKDLIAIDVGRSGLLFVVRLLHRVDDEPDDKVHDGKRRDYDERHEKGPSVGIVCHDNADDALGLSLTQSPRRRSSTSCATLLFPGNPSSSHPAFPVQ